MHRLASTCSIASAYCPPVCTHFLLIPQDLAQFRITTQRTVWTMPAAISK